VATAVAVAGHRLRRTLLEPHFTQTATTAAHFQAASTTMVAGVTRSTAVLQPQTGIRRWLPASLVRKRTLLSYEKTDAFAQTGSGHKEKGERNIAFVA
jgi:hypothetical protein